MNYPGLQAAIDIISECGNAHGVSVGTRDQHVTAWINKDGNVCLHEHQFGRVSHILRGR